MRQVLLDRLYSGDLRVGSSINETRLSDDLGVSRTPLREALLTLEFEGLVESSQGKGFSVPPLSEDTARDLYLLVGWLEGAAIRNEGLITDEQLEELHRLDQQMRKERSAGHDDEAIQLDMEWHALLVGSCGNREALEVLELLRKRLYLYEFLLASGNSAAQQTLDAHHVEIIEALEKKNPNLAVELVKHHWRTAAETRVRWLREREARRAHEESGDDGDGPADGDRESPVGEAGAAEEPEVGAAEEEEHEPEEAPVSGE